MTREYSNMTIGEIREKEDIGIRQAAYQKGISQILDDADKAQTVEELRKVFIRFITIQTGII